MKKSLLCVAVMAAMAGQTIAAEMDLTSADIGGVLIQDETIKIGNHVISQESLAKQNAAINKLDKGTVKQNARGDVFIRGELTMMDKNGTQIKVKDAIGQLQHANGEQAFKDRDQDTAIKQSQNDIKNLNDKVDANRVIWQQEISKDKLAIDQAQKDIASNKAAIDKNIKIDINQQNQIDALQSSDIANKTAIEQSQNDIKNLNDKVDANRVIWQQEISKDKLAIDQAQKDIVANKAEQDKKNAAQDQRIEESIVIGTQAQNNAAHAMIDNNRQDKEITANKNAIEANKEAIKNAQADVDSAWDAISETKTQVNANTIGVETNRAQINENTQAIEANKQAITKEEKARAEGDKLLQDAINTEAANRELADTKIQNSVAANYAEMKNNFAAVNSRIDNLDNEMKKGFAANAAIAGLFQPYSVGKFNVTAALGGYDSEQAIAIGSGYRFNENFAMKAGVATNTSDFDAVTYNVGVNFEW